MDFVHLINQLIKKVMNERKTGRHLFDPSTSVSDRQSPYMTYLFFALVGSSILFLAMIFMFVIWINQNELTLRFSLPKQFIVSTILILVSSFTLSSVKKCFRNDDAKGLLLSLSSTLFLGISFCVLQVLGWKSLYDHGFYIDGEVGISFLYIISGLHLAHILAGLLFLLYLTFNAFDNWNDPIKALVYFSNKYEEVKLEVFSTFWHFIDVLWVVLFFTFLFTF